MVKRICEPCGVMWRGDTPCWVCSGPGRVTYGPDVHYSNAYGYRAGDEVIT